ncbi:MAG TPA: HisA/HisF-related TIM barrel protein [Gemmatimonadales bacterium]|nr:HisA/HisF-related TIM barrel protein [Gemmatimonadales bacterium]
MPLELIPVLDLAKGLAVHAVEGDRARYAPVDSALTPGQPGDAVALARAYRQVVRAERCYVADLDAIVGGTTQRELLARLAAAEGFGGTLLVDAGIASAADLQRLAGVPATPVVGLETLRRWDDLAGLVAAAPTLIFSLDLRAGQPLGRPAALPSSGRDPVAIAVALAGAGVREVILLDLARVGRAQGPDVAVLAAVRAAVPGIRLLAGGGVRGADDVAHLEQIGVDGVLVASALHRGALAVGQDQSPRVVR